MSVERAAARDVRAVDAGLSATYRLLAEHAVDVVFHTEAGVLRWVSPSVTDVLGWDPAELIGTSAVPFFHPDDLVAAVDLRDRAGGGETVRSTVRMAHKAGGYRWIEVSMRPVAVGAGTSPAGGPSGVVGTLRDVTTQLEADAARAAAEERYRTLAENANDIVVRVGTDERLEWVSPSITWELGWTPAEVVGWPSRELVHPDDAERLRIAGRDATPTDPARVEVRLRTSAGHHRWFAVRYRQLVDAAGAVVGFVGAARDIDAEVSQRTELATVAEHYRMLAENASDIVAVIDAGRRITWIAPSVTRTLGWTPRQLVGTVVTNLVHVTDRLRVQASLRASGLDPQSFQLAGDTFKVRMRTAAAEYRWMSGRLHRLAGADDAGSSVLLSFVDVTDLVQAREAAQAERARVRAILDAAIDPHVTLDAVRDPVSGAIVDFVYSDANPAAVAYLQTTYGELVGTPLAGALPGVDTTGLLARYDEVVATGRPLALDDFVYPYHEIFGDERRYDIRATRVGDGISLTWRDVTQRFLEADAIARSEEKFRLLADNSSDVVLHLRGSTVAWVSPSLTADLDWSPEEWQDRVLADFLHPDDLVEVRRRREAVDAGALQVFRCRMQAADLAFHWVEIHAKPYHDRSGAQDGIVASFRTVDTEVRHEAELAHRAGHDELTGLLNRTALLDRLVEVAVAGPCDGRRAALVFCDIDRFKEINDTHGHLVGDEVLRVVAARIAGAVRRDDAAARFGGDELVVLLDGVDDLADAHRVAEKIRRAVRHPIPVPDGEIWVTTSVGVAVVEPGEPVDALVGRADEAMYRAKQAGRDQVVTIDVSDTARASRSSPGPDRPIGTG